MTRIYENRGFSKRNNISVVVLAVVFVYGFFELYRAFGGGGQDATAAMFGVLFIAGSVYGAYTIWTDGRDQVGIIDADFDKGVAFITLWRPFRNLVIEAPIDRLTGWRHWVKVGKRNMRTHMIYVNAPGYPNKLTIELTKGEMPEGFRRLAPQMVEEFEENTGKRADDAT